MQLLGFEKDSSDYCKNYLNFADNMFWSALEKILLDELSDLVPHYIKVFCGQLLHHEEPAYVKGSECRIVSDDPPKIRDCLKKSDILRRSLLLLNRKFLEFGSCCRKAGA